MLSRRTFLKLAGAAAVAPFIGLPHVARGAADDAPPVQVSAPPRPFGRAIQWDIRVRKQPSVYASVVKRLEYDQAYRLLGEAVSDFSPAAYNKVWYRVEDGWVHSAFVQPCENAPNEPITSVADPFWAEVTVPRAVARSAANPKAPRMFTYYFGSVFEVLEAVQGADAATWYRVSDGYARNIFVPAEALRRVDPSEVTPLSPEVPLESKSIVVDTVKQSATAFEYDKPVFTAKVATGAEFVMEDGSIQNFRTTKGTHRIFEKRFSSRMIGGTQSEADFYDLPGVSWVSYFTQSRIAFHTAYWHNDWGKPRSHGCVNMLPADALWVYRWTMPVADYEQRMTRVAKPVEGSLVKVI